MDGNRKPKTSFLKIFKIMPSLVKIGSVIVLAKIIGYKFFVAKDQNDLTEAYKIRYEVYRECGYIPENRERLFLDPHDQYSVCFIAVDRAGEVIGTMRLVNHSSLLFPAEKYFNLKLDIVDVKSAAEPSRLAVKKEYRKGNRIITLGLGIEAYRHSKKNNIRWWIATLPNRLATSLNRDFNLNVKLLPTGDLSADNLTNRKEIQGYFDKQDLQPYLIDLL